MPAERIADSTPEPELANTTTELLGNVDDLGEIRRKLWLLDLRRSARNAFDQLRLGSGRAERICAALVIGVILLALCLAVGVLIGVGVIPGMVIGLVALVVLVFLGVLLIVGPTDHEIEESMGILIDRRVKAQIAKTARPIGFGQTVPTPSESLLPVKPATRSCPYCAEEIQQDARKCKHCGEFLDYAKKTVRSAPSYGGLTCMHCGGVMTRTVISSGNCLGIIVALIVFLSGLFVLLAFFVTCIGAVIGALIMLLSLFMGGKTSKVWRCRNCGYYFQHA